MMNNRQRGLVQLHGFACLGALLLFFWVYGEFIMRYVPVVRLSREVNLLPYFLCVLLGGALGGRELGAAGPRLLRLRVMEAASLAAGQVVVVALVIFAMMFATQDRSISRLFVGTYLVFSWVLLGWLHLALPRRCAGLFFGGSQMIPTVVIGRPGSRPLPADWLSGRAELGMRMLGWIGLEPLPAGERAPDGWLGSLGDLPRLLDERGVGQVVAQSLPADPAEGRAIIEQCQARGCRLLIHHDIDERLGHPLVTVEEGGRHYLTLHDEPLEEPINRAVKRLYDIAVSLPVVLLILPPLCAAVWLAQRLQSPGPLFHIRSRAGEHRAQFAMLKFRTMHVAPPDERAEVRQASQEDDRVFPFGRWLRRHSLDEFPQFWNVLLGQMSIVGPRPVMPLLDEEFERQARAYRTRHLVKPGITGLAQSEGFRGEIRTTGQLQERIRLDLHYIAHWSFWLDVQVTARTLWQVFRPPPSAY